MFCDLMDFLDELQPSERLESSLLLLEHTVVAFVDKSYEAATRFLEAHLDATRGPLKRRFSVVAIYDALHLSYYLTVLIAAAFLGLSSDRLLVSIAVPCLMKGFSEEPCVWAWLESNGMIVWSEEEEEDAAGRLRSFLLFLNSDIEEFESRAYGAMKGVCAVAVYRTPNLGICALLAVLGRAFGFGLPRYLYLATVWCCYLGFLREVKWTSTNSGSNNDGGGNDGGESREGGRIDGDCGEERSENGRMREDCIDGEEEEEGSIGDMTTTSIDLDINGERSEEEWCVV